MRSGSIATSVIASMLLCVPCAAQAAPSPPPTSRAPEPHYWRRFALGFGGSIVLHEAGHLAAAYALGLHPTFGFDRGRLAINSGISVRTEAAKQFVFSGMGLTVQSLLDEAILDVPHARGGALERGVLAAGISTALFYATVGRDARVSDISLMSRSSSLSRVQLSLIFASVAAIHTIRIARDGHYVQFFAAPARDGGLRVGLRIDEADRAR